jgi:hypothetical protein
MTITYRTVVVHVPPTPLGLLPERWTIEHCCSLCRQRVTPPQLIAHAQGHEQAEHAHSPSGGVVNHDQPAHPRQQALTGALRCFYDAPRHRKLRPDCEGVAVVAYGPTTLCASCDLRRSTVGKATVPRAVPGFELGRLIDAAQVAADAYAELAQAAHAARQAGSSWTQIGDALGLTRQAAQQRWGQR